MKTPEVIPRSLPHYWIVSRAIGSICRRFLLPVPACGMARCWASAGETWIWQRGTLHVTQAVETVGGKLNVKSPKTERSRRAIKLPAVLVTEIELHRKEQPE
jgi:hypothetical protein